MAALERLKRGQLACSGQVQWPVQMRAPQLRVLHRRRTPLAAAALPPSASLQLMGSPFEQLDRQMAAMDRQLTDLQRQMDRDMDLAFRDVDRAMDQSLREVQRMQQQMDAEVARTVKEVQKQQQQLPGVRVERSEQRGYGSYRYYESIEIRTGPMTALAPATYAPGPASLSSPLLIAALALGALWAAFTALFAKNYNLTLFSDSARWRLLLTWPYLAAFSGRFRTQFLSALRGQKVKTPDVEGKGAGRDA